MVGWVGLGDAAVAAGTLKEADAASLKYIELARRGGNGREVAVGLSRRGDVQVAQGDLAGALKSYRDSLAIADRLAKSDPGNAGWQRDLSVSYEKIGDVQVAQGDLAGALNPIATASRSADRLAKADPGNAGWQRDLSVSYDKVGDVQVAQGDLAGRAEILSRQPRHQRAAGESRSRQRRLAARSVGVVRESRRRAGGAGRPCRGAEILSRQPRDQQTVWRKPTPATPAGSAICRCRTRRSATCRWRRATSRGR